VVQYLPRIKDKYDITVLACNWHGDPVDEQKDFRMFPASNRFQQAPFGEERIREIVEREEPDIVFTLNDPWIASQTSTDAFEESASSKEKFKFCWLPHYG
jgi:hypothetical protein